MKGGLKASEVALEWALAKRPSSQVQLGKNMTVCKVSDGQAPDLLQITESKGGDCSTPTQVGAKRTRDD